MVRSVKVAETEDTMKTATEHEIERINGLHQRFDGAIPAHLLNPQSEAEQMQSHHLSMIRYCSQRIADYTASIAKLEQKPDEPTKAIWLRSMRENLDDMRVTKARHEAELAELTAPAQIAAE